MSQPQSVGSQCSRVSRQGVGSCEKGREPEAGAGLTLLRALGNSYCYSQVPSRRGSWSRPRTCELGPLRAGGVELLSDHLMFGGDVGRCLQALETSSRSFFKFGSVKR